MLLNARLTVTFAYIIGAAAFAQSGYEGHYMYLGDHPDERDNDWAEEAQGLAHDDSHWFITQKSHLWKLPVTQDLSSCCPDPDDDPRVIRRSLDICSQGPWGVQCIEGDIPELEGYDHFGDLDYHQFNGSGYLFVPTEGGPRAIISVFSADTLQYLDCFVLDQECASWCALDPIGNLYTSPCEDANHLLKFRLNWNGRRQAGGARCLIPEAREPIWLYEERDNSNGELRSVAINSLQGGEFTESGDMLYLSAGYTGDQHPSWGLHVFEKFQGGVAPFAFKRVQRSTDGTGYFNFAFDPTCCTYEEPEGLTIWELDDVGAPGMGGQLHVILLDNDYWGDDVYIKHYTNRILVDRAYSGTEQQGTPNQPFKTVSDAAALAWDGAEIRIAAGAYPEPLTIGRRVRLAGRNGIVTIGR